MAGPILSFVCLHCSTFVPEILQGGANNAKTRSFCVADVADFTCISELCSSWAEQKTRETLDVSARPVLLI